MCEIGRSGEKVTVLALKSLDEGMFPSEYLRKHNLHLNNFEIVRKRIFGYGEGVIVECIHILDAAYYAVSYQAESINLRGMFREDELDLSKWEVPEKVKLNLEKLLKWI